MFNDPPRRKRMRLINHDYAGGTYFATICTIDKHPILGNIKAGTSILSPIGEIVEHEWIRLRYIVGITLDEFVVMPNHVHGIIAIERGCGRTLPSVMQLFKSRAVKALQVAYRDRECRIWQRGYHDEIINNSNQLEAIRQYIRLNPIKWETDEYRPHTPDS